MVFGVKFPFLCRVVENIVLDCASMSGNKKSSVCMDIVRRTYGMETNEVWKWSAKMCMYKCNM